MSLSTIQFYPTTTTTTDQARYQRLVAAEKSVSSLVPEYRQSVAGPSTARRDFSRQEQAIQFASLDTDYTVFAYEVGRRGESAIAQRNFEAQLL